VGMLTTYARAALPLIPGAAVLPFVAGGGGEMPPLERSRAGVQIDAGHLADYAHVCGFTLRDTLPATYLHVLAFPLHMSLMTDGRFPFPAIGLVHLENRIAVHRSLPAGEAYDLSVHATPIEPHAKGKTFAIVSEARIDGELVWEDRSTMLKRGAKADAAPAGGVRTDSGAAPAADAGTALATGPADSSAEPQATWRLPENLGRSYGAASGDRNPIHLHRATAKLFGFPRAIAHGMWTKAACLAALEARLPDAYVVDVAFRKPILLPGAVTFAATDDERRFAVRGAKHPDVIHLEGTVTQ
jgi:acyl dehydratase